MTAEVYGGVFMLYSANVRVCGRCQRTQNYFWISTPYRKTSKSRKWCPLAFMRDHKITVSRHLTWLPSSSSTTHLSGDLFCSCQHGELQKAFWPSKKNVWKYYALQSVNGPLITLANGFGRLTRWQKLLLIPSRCFHLWFYKREPDMMQQFYAPSLRLLL